MQEDSTSAEQLIEKAEAYGKTTIELIRLKSIEKTADVLSYLAGYFVLFIFIGVFAMLLNIGIALWIGEMVGKVYYGFLIVALFYGILSLCFYTFRNQWIKEPLNNAIINRFLKK
ncbi:MAG: hypothetical protein IPO63_04320 [Bacteroidetes bacterium]|nr:hypothetical protein [Bacteroidota bacterium]